MKTWNDLTKDEIEKLNFYYQMTIEDKIFMLTMLAVMFVGAFIAIALMFVPYILIQTSAIIVFLVIIYLSFKTLRYIERYKKNIKLIFDTDDVIEDVFEITKEDRNKIKRKMVKVK